MLMAKIIMFYVLLVVFIAASWLWHRIWFKDGLSEPFRDSENAFVPRNPENQAAGQGAQTTGRAGTVVLVLAVLIGIYLIIYALLA